MKKILLLAPLIVLLFSCKEEDDSDPVTPFAADSGGVYISNEGVYRQGNASVTYYNPSDNRVAPDAYYQANHQALGDICQSMRMINGEVFIVVNNSGKIEVCEPYKMVRLHTISGFTSPRYIFPVSNSKAYVTDLYSNKISVVDLNSYSITGSILLNGWTEQMIQKNNLVYVTNYSSDYLYIIDANTDQLSDSILISKGANSICQDIDGKIWVLCGDDYLDTYSGALYRIDPSTHNIELNLSFNGIENPSRLCMNRMGTSLYFINTHVYRMNISDMNLPASPIITSNGNQFYGLRLDPHDIIYVSDAIDFIQRGKVYLYSVNGTEIKSFYAGILPGDFLFLD